MIYFLFLLTYLIGYIAGYFNGKHQDSLEAVVDILGKTTTSIKNKVKPTMQTGVIKNPTAKDLYERKLPNHVREGKQAMKETLDKIPELQKAKEYVQQLKRSGAQVL